MPIDSSVAARKYRDRVIDLSTRKVLISRLAGSEQAADLTEPPNISGLGRIRHFRRSRAVNWVPNPLPIDPARFNLGLPESDSVNAQVFQLAACNWRCWYCFVPFDLLAARMDRAQWVSAEELVGAYSTLPDRPPVLDISGGEVNLAPEFVLWTMRALEKLGLSNRVYLWSDDNLSVDYQWCALTEADRAYMSAYKNYGRVGCFKGIDELSFAFNTGAQVCDFERQFELMKRLVQSDLDVYGYITLTHAYRDTIHDRIAVLFDRLQGVDENLPLRIVPLEVSVFSPVRSRLDEDRRWAVEVGQYRALEAWTTELSQRFSALARGIPIHQVKWASV